jgi:uncharacterized protein (TIGR03437 family)
MPPARVRLLPPFVAAALTVVALCLSVAKQSRAGSNETTSSGVVLHWPNGTPNPIVINPGAVPNFTGALDQLIVAGAIRDAFRAWTEVPGAAIHFTDNGLTTQTLTSPSDHLSLVTFQDNTVPFGPATLALTLTFFNPSTGVITDADIAFNPQPPNGEFFSPVGADGSADIIAVATHEIGHLLGLDHTGILSSIMNPFAEAGSSGISSRRIQSDDDATISALYPVSSFAASNGSIAGTITTSTGSPVRTAHVVAISQPGGQAVASQLSGPTGSYRIDSLPPGNYFVLVEPLDGPVSLSDWSNPFYSSGQANFATTLFGGLGSPAAVTVAAGQTATANVTLAPNPVSILNIQFTGPLVNGGGTLLPGSSFFPRGKSYQVGAIEATHAADSTMSFSGSGIVTVGGTTGANFGGTPARLQNITVDAAAPLGPSNLTLANATSASVMPGGVVITVNPQVAVPLRDGAAFGTGLAPGSFLSIFGNDLAESLVSATHLPLPTSLGGVSVKIGGRFAPLFFVSPTQINALVPFEVSGIVTVQVVTGPNGGGNLVPIILAATSPGIFTLSQQGTGQGAIRNSSDNSFAAPVGSVPGEAARPAHPNDIIIIYASGLGKTTPVLASGLDSAVNGTAAPQNTNYPTVRIGGIVAALDFAGLAPTFAGLYQINAHVPANAPTGDAVPVQITTFEGQTSNSVTIAIGP